MGMRRLTLCARLRKAFMRGETVNAAAFADKVGFSESEVYRSLHLFGGIVKASQPGVWVCVDMARMSTFQTPRTVDDKQRKRTAARQRFTREVAAPAAWAQLLTAWGLPLSPPDIKLPTRPHFMARAEDNEPEHVS